MGIAILNELQQRLHTIAIAGTNLLSEDFRLKKTAEQFHTISASSPVLSKIDQLIQQLFCENVQKEIILLDAIALVDAVVCTQAEYNIKETEQMQKITLFSSGMITNTKYSELEPVIAALTTTGSGRYEILQHCYKNKKEILKDFRIQHYLIQALDDSYIADFIEKILIEIGQDVIPLCKYQFDVMGGRNMVRRLNVIGEVAKENENEYYISLLENTSPAIKEKAILLLGYSNQNIDLLIHLAETEKAKYKSAALTALSSLKEQKSIEYILMKSKKKAQMYLPYLKYCDTKEVSDAFAEELEKILQELLQLQEKVIPDALAKKMISIFSAINFKHSDKMINVLQKYGQESQKLDVLIKENRCAPFFVSQTTIPCYDEYHDNKTYYYSNLDWRNAFKITSFIECKLIENILADRKYISMVKELYKRCGEVYLSAMFLAELLTEPEKTYDLFSPYFHNWNAVNKMWNILQCIQYYGDGYYIHYYFNSECEPQFIAKEMDIRWIESLTERKNNIWKQNSYEKYYPMFYTIQKWIDYDNEKTIPLFRQKIRQYTAQEEYTFDLLKKLGENNFQTLVASFASARLQSPYLPYNILKLLEELPFTIQQRGQEAKMILSQIQQKNMTIKNRPQYIDFQKQLQDMVNQAENLKQTIKEIE